MNVIAEQPNLFRAKRTSISTCIRLPARSRFGKGRRSPWGLESKLWNTIADTLVDSGSNLIRLLSLSSHVPGMTHRLWFVWLEEQIYIVWFSILWNVIAGQQKFKRAKRKVNSTASACLREAATVKAGDPHEDWSRNYEKRLLIL